MLIVGFVKLLCPLACAPIIQCVGVNYQNHVTETKVYNFLGSKQETII